MSRRVLIVEDTEDNLLIINDIMAALGWEVIMARDGSSGVELALADPPELIIMDMQLPMLDGYEAARILRSNEVTCSIPILAITSYALSGDREKALASGCSEYLAKPFSPRDLRAMVGRLCVS